jgi:exportin-5
MLAVSTEKLKKTELAYELACNIWHDIIPIILPVLLQLVRRVTHAVRGA